jgi:N-acetylmuramoyl-L-alanine amidase
MSKVFIGVGHGGSTIKGGDPGAVSGKFIEADINLVTALACKAELERHGVTVGISRTKDEIVGLGKEVQMCNAFAPDIAIECHNNAGGGQGFEVYRQQSSKHAARSLKLAQLVEKHVLADIDTKSRGIKGEISPAGGYIFGWLKCNCPSVLCEGEFVDSAAGQARLSTDAKQRAYGVAYAKAALELLGIAYKPTGAMPTTEVYRVRESWENAASQKGAFNSLESAKTEANKHGYNVYDSAGKLVYTPPKADSEVDSLKAEIVRLNQKNETLQADINALISGMMELTNKFTILK